jgi:MFS family permease
MSLPVAGVAALQGRTVRVLVGSQMLGGVGVASGIAVLGLLAEDVSGSTTLSGLASTTLVLGTAAASLPLARLSDARGRRPGLAAGWATGAVGALVMVLAAAAGWFLLLLAGALLFGAATRRTSRRATPPPISPSPSGGAVRCPSSSGRRRSVPSSAPTSPAPERRPRAGCRFRSWPGRWSSRSLPSGSGHCSSRLSCAPDPLLVARAARTDADILAAAEDARLRRSRPARASLRAAMAVIRASRGAVLGLTTLALGHTFMVAVMTMTPVHMRHGGAELEVVGLVISVHIAGMYAASPLVGWLVDRAGRVPVVYVAQTLLLLSVVVSGGLAHSSTALAIGCSCSASAGRVR